MIKLEKFQGHIVLYCKGHYQGNNVDFVKGLQRIWAIRCGCEQELINDSANEYIADEMYKIIETTIPKKIPYLIPRMHKTLASRPLFFTDDNLSAIEKIIKFYKSEIMMLKVRVRAEGKKRHSTLVKLPKPQKRLFKKIVKGEGEYSDYNLVK